MTDDRSARPYAVPSAASAPPVVPALQLAQVRVPLDQAADALSMPDAAGRLPIVLLPRQTQRIRNEFVVGGAIALVVGFLVNVDLVLRTVLLAVGAILLVLGVFRSFLVPVPEGAQAVLLKRGKFSRTLGPGNHVVSPTLIVSHLVTTREVPFDAPATEIPTADDVRTNVDILFTFRIVEPQKFVFTISASDFDQVCQATCQEAVRLLFRAKTLDQVLGVGAEAADALRANIGTSLAPYGIEIGRVVVTQVRPPLEFLASLEARRLAAVQRSEEQEQHALVMLRQADREELERDVIVARGKRIDLEAANEVTRLERLEQRLQDFPNAMRWDVETERLAVARALASNTRAMVQVGQGFDVASSLLNTLPAEPPLNGSSDAPGGATAGPGDASAATKTSRKSGTSGSSDPRRAVGDGS